MTGLVYKELPIEDITHLTRAEFINGQEQKFYNALLNSMTEHGMRDPIFISQRKDKEDKVILKVLVGNNRKVIAKQLGLKLIRSIVKLLDPNDNNIEGRPLNNEQEIIDLGEFMQYDDPSSKCEFVFTNTGKEPLIISKAKGTGNVLISVSFFLPLFFFHLL